MGSKDLTEFLKILQKKCETAINWFKTNNATVNSSSVKWSDPGHFLESQGKLYPFFTYF